MVCRVVLTHWLQPVEAWINFSWPDDQIPGNVMFETLSNLVDPLGISDIQLHLQNSSVFLAHIEFVATLLKHSGNQRSRMKRQEP